MKKRGRSNAGRALPEKQQVTIRLDTATVAYFKALADDSGIAYQSLINLYLRDCVAQRRRLQMLWET
ncbi:MAG: BrnA antitoxin family protein [Pseudomonadota bacterium]